MRKLFTILALIAAIVALILSVLPLSNLAYIPAVAALVFGLLAVFVKKSTTNTKTVNLSFFLTVIALGFTVDKSVFTTSEVGNTEAFDQKAEESVEASIDALENIDIIDETTLDISESTESVNNEDFTEEVVIEAPKTPEKTETSTPKEPEVNTSDDEELEPF